jgi:hypothetical protein
VSPEVRIGDREREQATALLNEHYTAGRLDTAEHGERLDAIWSARTRADLDQVFWDLPRLAPVPPCDVRVEVCPSCRCCCSPSCSSPSPGSPGGCSRSGRGS